MRPGARPWPLAPRPLLAASLLAAQLACLGYSFFTPLRYFRWSPYDRQTRFSVEVAVGGRRLTPEQALARYRLPAHGWDQRSPANVLDKIRQYEETYGRGDGARVRVRYDVNGGPVREWRWPR
ncbi:MAG: hypothetical protein SF051_07790 [Elusimicrobiota bacterium]|nr:hypothetical protein [Elusimicrobiota bacterium]